MPFAATIYRFTLPLASLLSAAAIGWMAFQLQQQKVLPSFMFPLLFPLLIGMAVGASGARLLRSGSIGRATSLVVTGCGGLIAVAIEVLTGYQYYVATVERQLQSHPLATLARDASDDFAPASLARFMASQMRDHGGWWTADAVLTVLASIAICWLLHVRTPMAPVASSPNSP